MGRVIGALIAIGAIFGMKFYNKSNASDDIRAQLIKICKEDTACSAAVNTHFESCFGDAYTMGGRRTDAKFDYKGFTSCVNTKAGIEYFSFR